MLQYVPSSLGGTAWKAVTLPAQFEGWVPQLFSGSAIDTLSHQSSPEVLFRFYFLRGSPHRLVALSSSAALRVG